MFFDGPIERRIKRALKESIHDAEVQYAEACNKLKTELKDSIRAIKDKTKEDIDATAGQLVKKITG